MVSEIKEQVLVCVWIQLDAIWIKIVNWTFQNLTDFNHRFQNCTDCWFLRIPEQCWEWGFCLSTLKRKTDTSGNRQIKWTELWASGNFVQLQFRKIKPLLITTETKDITEFWRLKERTALSTVAHNVTFPASWQLIRRVSLLRKANENREACTPWHS